MRFSHNDPKIDQANYRHSGSASVLTVSVCQGRADHLIRGWVASLSLYTPRLLPTALRAHNSQVN
jgi:hypothetical protein